MCGSPSAGTATRCASRCTTFTSCRCHNLLDGITDIIAWILALIVTTTATATTSTFTVVLE